ncbi:Uncharacterized protein Fot_06022 [Forsythia ovata]|uniref:Uncharacterized protein n=1 Tax=Forsythia ovata TaxID=205694 RepID=A0ABD1WRU2_9LAMI
MYFLIEFDLASRLFLDLEGDIRGKYDHHSLIKVPDHALVPAPKIAPAHAPVPAPKKAPVHSPAHAPIPAPKKAPVHAPAHVPIPAPKKAPVHAPAHAPAKHHVHAHPPKKAHVHAPAKPPIHPPSKAPTPPISPISLTHAGCVPKCEEYCKPVSPKRPCMKVCTACCAKYKCVPGSKKCPNWDRVMIHGAMVKCP